MKKQKSIFGKSLNQGVSTLDFAAKSLVQMIFLLALTLFAGGIIYAGAREGHSILDSVDTTFDPQIATASFGLKFVYSTAVGSDGKIFASGYFNSYNRDPVGGLIRLNADGSLDRTFNNNLLGTTNGRNNILLQPDGKILVYDLSIAVNGQTSPSKTLLRLNSDGTLDTSFNFVAGGEVTDAALDAAGRIIISRNTSVVGLENLLTRLNPDGSKDSTFKFTPTDTASSAYVATQNNKVIVALSSCPIQIKRLNEDGSTDESFASMSRNFPIRKIMIQPDNKILIQDNRYLFRLNQNGGADSTFQQTDFFNSATNTFAYLARLAGDGKITVITTSIFGFIVQRFLSDGTKDASFRPYTHAAVGSFALHSDGSVILGDDYNGGTSPGRNIFVRLFADGTADASFNSGGIGFQTMTFGSVWAIGLQPNGKVLIGGKFDEVNNLPRPKLARLNADSTVDSSFQTNSNSAGNYFSQINNIYNITVQTDGKVLISGDFLYFLNGAQQRNLARLNADGSLDTMSYNVNQEVLCLASDREGRVLVGGGFASINAGDGQNHSRTYVARLINSSISASKTRFDFDGDGRADLALFSPSDGFWSIRNIQSNQISNTQFGQTGDKYAPADYDNDGKTDIAVFRPSNGNWYLLQSTAGFAAIQWGTSGDKPIPGDFDGDGKAELAVWRPSNGVWYILRNSTQYIFYQFDKNGDIPLSADFDGDGKTDIGVYRPSDNNFYWAASGSNNLFKAVQFGTAGDIPAVADFNGDGRADLAVFRPSNGVWYQYLTKTDGGFTFSALQFGQNSDEPAAADYDGDGLDDIAVRRQGVWYILMSGQGYTGISFGASNAQAVVALQKDVIIDDGGLSASPLHP